MGPAGARPWRGGSSKLARAACSARLKRLWAASRKVSPPALPVSAVRLGRIRAPQLARVRACQRTPRGVAQLAARGAATLARGKRARWRRSRGAVFQASRCVLALGPRARLRPLVAWLPPARLVPTSLARCPQSVKDLITRQEKAPPGGFPAVRYARRLPSTGPTGATLFAVGAVISMYGFYKVGVMNGKRRCGRRPVERAQLDCWMTRQAVSLLTSACRVPPRSPIARSRTCHSQGAARASDAGAQGHLSLPAS